MFSGGVGGIWTHARFDTPNGFRNRPLITTWVLLRIYCLYGADCRNRTYDLLITSQSLWPAELNRQIGGVGRQESNLTVFSRTTTLNQNRHIYGGTGEIRTHARFYTPSRFQGGPLITSWVLFRYTSANHEITGLLEELSTPYCLASYPRLFRIVLSIPG